MARRSGTADLPLHGGRVPGWLAARMTNLAGLIIEAIVEDAGPHHVLTRLSDPFWFQAFGAVLGMDWHSSGITTSVLGALKRSLADRQDALGLYVCGGRGRHSRKTPDELLAVANRTGLDGDELATTSRLVAKVDNNALSDGHQIYLHSFIVTQDGHWVVIQQGMAPDRGTARRYHWRSDLVTSFVEEPHEGIVGPNQGVILNLTDRRAAAARQAMCDLTRQPPQDVTNELRRIRHLDLPAHHDIRVSDVLLNRLQATLVTAAQRPIEDLTDLLLVPGLGPRTVQALALVSEVVYGAPSRFDDPARFAFAHGGKDGHPHPVPLKVYDQSIATLRAALDRAVIGRTDKIEAFRRLDRQVRMVERSGVIDGPDLNEIMEHELLAAPGFGGRTVGQGRQRPSNLGRTESQQRPQAIFRNDSGMATQPNAPNEPNRQLTLPGIEPADPHKDRGKKPRKPTS